MLANTQSYLCTTSSCKSVSSTLFCFVILTNSCDGALGSRRSRHLVVARHPPSQMNGILAAALLSRFCFALFSCASIARAIWSSMALPVTVTSIVGTHNWSISYRHWGQVGSSSGAKVVVTSETSPLQFPCKLSFGLSDMFTLYPDHARSHCRKK